ncbi:MAG: alpha/beta fold hydrolase [Proteobacteria bacterium]|nr:alpha/beta fold hydrolase [Pseudomonadota bacterium]
MKPVHRHKYFVSMRSIKKLKARIQLLAFTAIFTTGCTEMAAEPETAATLKNVPYSDVSSLPARNPDGWLKYGDDPVQFILQWEPQLSAKGLLILIHGGCWLNSFDVDHIRALASALATEGYAVFAVEYRRTGDEGGGWPGTLADITAALDTIVDHTGSTDAILIGHSAGGHLALHAARRQPASVKAVIGMAAITDLSSYASGSNSCQSAAVDFMGGTQTQHPTAYEAAGLADKILHPRSILLHGEADGIVDIDQARLEGAATHIEPGAGHFDWIHPGTAAFSTLLVKLDELVRVQNTLF